jgi:hypothetical protein
MTINPHNPYGVVMQYVINKGQPQLRQLFIDFGIPAEPTPANIRQAILKHGVPFLAAFDSRIVRPYSKELYDKLNQLNFEGGSILQGFTPATQYAAQSSSADFASTAKDPERGNKLWEGLSLGLGLATQVAQGIGSIKGKNNQPEPPTSYIPLGAAKESEDEEKKKKTLLYVGIGLVVLIVGIFAYMKLKK